VVIDGTVHNVYVLKRPGVDDFLTRMAQCYEVIAALGAVCNLYCIYNFIIEQLIIYTASLSKYADPLLDLLDPDQVYNH